MNIETLAGLRVLVVEDEAIIAMLLEEMLQDFGCRIIGFASSIEKALAAVGQYAVDGVLLDMSLHGHDTLPVAEELLTRSVPFLLVTGYGPRDTEPSATKTAPRLKKPFTQEELARRMTDVFVLKARI